MGIGISIFLIAVGAIFAFATDLDVQGVDLNAMGVILMLVGVAWLLLSLVLYQNQRRGSVVTRRRVIQDSDRAPEEQIVEERRTYSEPPDVY